VKKENAIESILVLHTLVKKMGKVWQSVTDVNCHEPRTTKQQWRNNNRLLA